MNVSKDFSVRVCIVIRHEAIWFRRFSKSTWKPEKLNNAPIHAFGFAPNESNADNDNMLDRLTSAQY